MVMFRKKGGGAVVVVDVEVDVVVDVVVVSRGVVVVVPALAEEVAFPSPEGRVVVVGSEKGHTYV